MDETASTGEERVYFAPHAGELTIGEVKIACAVTDDGVRLLSERAVTKAFGGKRGGSHWRRKRRIADGANLPVFLSANNLRPYIDNDLRLALSKPMLYRTKEGDSPIAFGVPATALPEMCEVLLKASDARKLHPKQKHIAAQANILMRGLAHVGIIALVDEATGYQYVRDRLALTAILDKYIGKELAIWEKTFQDEFYEQLFKLRGWAYNPKSSKRPILVGKLTIDMVYKRLAPGVLKELKAKAPRNERGQLDAKLFQMLSQDYGYLRLKEHLSNVTVLMKASSSWTNFHRMLQRALPKYGDTIGLPFEDDLADSE